MIQNLRNIACRKNYFSVINLSGFGQMLKIVAIGFVLPLREIIVLLFNKEFYAQ
jgi:hypothetical protein